MTFNLFLIDYGHKQELTKSEIFYTNADQLIDRRTEFLSDYEPDIIITETIPKAEV